MATPTSTTSPPAGAPGAKPPLTGAETAAAVGISLSLLAAVGPLGLAVSLLAVGIERAFLKSGWDKPGLPDWLQRGPVLTPQEREARRQDALKAARQFLDDYRSREAERAAAHRAHRRAHRDWMAGGRQGEEPRWSGSRGPAQFGADLFRASQSWCRLFSDKLGREFDKFNDSGQAFFRNLWGFLTGFVEGVKDEWQLRKKLKAEQQANEQQWHDTDERPGPGTAGTAGDNTSDARPLGGTAGWSGTGTTTPGPGPSLGPQTDDPQRPIHADATVGSESTNPRPVTAGGPAIEGEVMAADGTPAQLGSAGGAVAPGSPQGTTNLDLIFMAFEPIPPLLGSIEEQCTDLGQERLAVEARVNRIAELCAVRGAPVAVHQMMDHARQFSLSMGRRVTLAHEYTENARELAASAVAGLQPAAANQAETHGQQARGDVYDRAGAE